MTLAPPLETTPNVGLLSTRCVAWHYPGTCTTACRLFKVRKGLLKKITSDWHGDQSRG